MNDETSSLLGDGTYRAHWLRTIIKTPQVTDSIRVLLMTLALHMDASGRVSVPREDIAALLGRNPRKVGEKVKIALESGFLIQTARGQKHQTAVYRAAVGGQILSMSPGSPADSADLSVPPESPAENSQGADFYDPEPNSQGRRNRPPETQGADLRTPPGGPAEDSQVAPRGAPQYLKGVDVGEEVDPSDDSLFGVEPAASRRGAKKPKNAKASAVPKTSIPDDFAITNEMRAWARENCPSVSLEIETRIFINYWQDRPQIKRPGWRRSWENWVLREQSRINQRQGNVRQLRPTGTGGPPLARSTADERVAQAQSLKGRFGPAVPPTIRGEITP